MQQNIELQISEEVKTLNNLQTEKWDLETLMIFSKIIQNLKIEFLKKNPKL
jgi:hypothetical protein